MCPRCQRHQLVEVEVRVGDSTLTMHACSGCDHRWWDRDGRPVELGDVIALAADRR